LQNRKRAYKELFTEFSRRYGFAGIGFSKARRLDEESKKLEAWLKKGNHGTMRYMENHFDLRVDPTKLVPGAKSVVSLLYNYYPNSDDLSIGDFKIARYAYGKDYHKVIKKKLKVMMGELRDEIGAFAGRCFVDSAPILEREWAELGGLGWKGKNTLLINPKKGSYFFLTEIICDLEFEWDDSISDHCGTCTKCIDACPTDAISENGFILDASSCISYLTIERKDSLPKEFQEKMEGWMFGCDICQEVCPWNRFSNVHSEPKFEVNESLSKMTSRDWVEISEEVFDEIFYGSAVKRTKYEGLKRNINFISSS